MNIPYGLPITCKLEFFLMLYVVRQIIMKLNEILKICSEKQLQVNLINLPLNIEFYFSIPANGLQL